MIKHMNKNLRCKVCVYFPVDESQHLVAIPAGNRNSLRFSSLLWPQATKKIFKYRTICLFRASGRDSTERESAMTNHDIS